MPKPISLSIDRSGHEDPLLIYWVGFVLLGILVYSNSFQVPFIFDDIPNITDNGSIRKLSPLYDVLKGIPELTGIAGRPLINLSLALNYAISGESVWSYHLLNLTVHLLAAGTLFGILTRTFSLLPSESVFHPAPKPAAFICTLIWMLHPIHTQAVTYTIQRCESMMGLFLLLSLYTAIRGWQSDHQARWHLAAVASFFFGIACKEVVVAAPIFIFLYDGIIHRRNWRAILRRSPVLYGGLVLGWAALALLVSGAATASTAKTDLTVWQYLCTQCQVLIHYLRLALWPSGLTFDYGWPTASFYQALPYGVAIFGLLVPTTFALFRRRPAGLAGAWFFLILGPTSSLLPIPDPAFEHRMYLPLIAVVVVVVGAVGTAFHHLKTTGPAGLKRVLPHLEKVVIIGVITALGTATFYRNHDYRSGIALWSDTARKAPWNPRAFRAWGDVLIDAGRYDEAAEKFTHALTLNPEDQWALRGLGLSLAYRNRIEEAIHFFAEAIARKPAFAEAHTSLGVALMIQNRYSEAAYHFSIALKIRPRYAQSHNNLALALWGMSRKEAAARHFREALRIDPTYNKAQRNLDRMAQGDEALTKQKDTTTHAGTINLPSHFQD